MKQQKTIQLLNTTFTINKQLKKDLQRVENLKTLYECYNNPSRTKEKEYYKILTFINNLRSRDFGIIEDGILTYNIFQFTYLILCYDITNKKYYLIKFTKDNNFILELSLNDF